ncbi:acyl-CoA dehydrogenase [Microbotryum lychnidis-dioicae p1A1 Lamole]|uniref:Acyl-CoA dehydrogenase n=1 Tax=Microbotryum lychnidis-dioicae (strain p1A1 Lamole / MvSl-1064) TaxID=683840 RepID=U5H0U2_USTV1|nr:acyl-CoA dehydrogenase [Microbotryum lychnidis-dioicae p1A1 Lamole]|eukprot:KDE08919.1 acyl-CoA dehydrogenase [Microbotryum lychnidis-dioicae p1A1 Lamole]
MTEHVVTQYISPSAWALIEDKFSSFAKDTLAKVCKFVEEDCIPAEAVFHAQVSTDPATRWKTYPAVMEQLKTKARSMGLWNLFLSKEHYPDVGVPLTNLEYAVMAEIMGRAPRIAPEACNCAAPDTGNMEVLARYGSQAQKDKWLKPLLDGKTRSSFAMTEVGVASSDATNIRTSIRQEGNEIVINGHKWWISGAGDPRNALHLVMGKSDTSASKHQQQSIVIVPSNAKGVKLVRPMQVFGYDDAPEGHYEIIYENVRVPLDNLLLGWGRGFEIIQGRLGPGRIHHCMRSIGIASRALEAMLIRATDPAKVAFGKQLYQHGTVVAGIAQSRMEIDQARLLVLSAALQIDRVRAKGAMKDIGMAKAVVPIVVGQVIDRAMQVHGAEGVCQDTPLAALWAAVRTLRFADGPDEVHIQQIGLQELKRAPGLHVLNQKKKDREAKLFNAAGIKSSHL